MLLDIRPTSIFVLRRTTAAELPGGGAEVQRKLNCGHISISGSKCNYFVNDQASLIHVISPIFNYVQLNSTKHFDFLTFDKAVNLVKNKEHLSRLPPCRS